jgi:hypothetical protein
MIREASVRAATDCIHHAKECRRLAKLAVKPEDLKHFVEMAETWELLAKQRKADEQIADKQIADEQIADEQGADEQISAERISVEQVATEQAADEQTADQQVSAEQVATEQAADEQIVDEQIPDEHLADILALADAIANRRDKRLPAVRAFIAPHSIVTRYGRRRRKRKLTDYQRAEATKRRAAGETLAQIAKSYGVEISTILRSLI